MSVPSLDSKSQDAMQLYDAHVWLVINLQYDQRDDVDSGIRKFEQSVQMRR